MSRPSGDHRLSAALERAVIRFGTMVRNVGARHGLLGADAEELIQEVRIRLWKTLRESEKIREATASYVYRTVMSAAVDLIRRRRAGVETVSTSAHGDAPTPIVRSTDHADRDLRRAELAQEIQAALDTLSDARRPVVRMHLAGYDRHEIAGTLQWTEAKTRNLLYRGLDDLRAALRDRGLDPGERS